MRFLYTLSIYLYLLVIRFASLFNAKAKRWIDGRKNIFAAVKMRMQGGGSDLPDTKLIWFHCASLGEFEQGRPLLEKFKVLEPSCRILLTFFSPSGYEVRKNYSGADFVFYLPLDTPSNAKAFIDIVKPDAVFFVKYEFWFNYLHELKKQNISTYLISGIFRKDHYFFKPSGAWFRRQLSCFTHFYLQDEPSAVLLRNAGFTNVTVAGDTRFDRVYEAAKNGKAFPLIELFKGNKNVFIAGSSWPEDEKITAEWYAQQSAHMNFKLIVAPHEIDEPHIQSILQRFNGFKTVRYTQADPENIKDAAVLIIDNIGMLSFLYRYASIAFIGGGFGRGIHNILEAAAFGVPVIFGPNYQKFTEAKELLHLGGAFSIDNAADFDKAVSLLMNDDVLKTASHISKFYIQNKAGAADKIAASVKL